MSDFPKRGYARELTKPNTKIYKQTDFSTNSSNSNILNLQNNAHSQRFWPGADHEHGVNRLSMAKTDLHTSIQNVRLRTSRKIRNLLKTERILRKQIIGRKFYDHAQVDCTNHTISSNIHTYWCLKFHKSYNTINLKLLRGGRRTECAHRQTWTDETVC